MSADNVSYNARFKTDKSNYEEIKNTLIKDFINLGLEPDEYFEDDVKGWKTLFEEKKDYLELEIYNCYGNWGHALEYIEKNFVKKYPDVIFEFFCIEDYGPEKYGEQITYDGKKVFHDSFGVDISSANYEFDIPCPECGGHLTPAGDYIDEVYCDECDAVFSGEELGVDCMEISEEIISGAMELFDEHIGFKLIK